MLLCHVIIWNSTSFLFHLNLITSGRGPCYHCPCFAGVKWVGQGSTANEGQRQESSAGHPIPVNVGFLPLLFWTQLQKYLHLSALPIISIMSISMDRSASLQILAVHWNSAQPPHVLYKMSSRDARILCVYCVFDQYYTLSYLELSWSELVKYTF